MSQSDSELIHTHHAILIGVGVSVDRSVRPGCQESTPQDRSLKGTIADIDAIEEYLKVEQHVKVTRLTATKSTQAQGRIIPVESSSSLATLENVLRTLQQVIDEGVNKQTKHVYIHFSGHGTRIHGNGQLALVLYDPGVLGKSYLHGDDLRRALILMAKAGMSVTLVLDCCFSGSVQRSDQHPAGLIRFLEYDPNVDREFKSSGRFPFITVDDVRDSILKVDQLLKPEGYVIFTAGGPHGTAAEMDINGQGRRGVLSYFLDRALRLLRLAGTQVTHQTLYGHLLQRFHAVPLQPAPMRYGLEDVCFFGGLMRGSSTSFVSVSHNPKSDSLILYAGAAHGVQPGDEYGAYPFYASENRQALLDQHQLMMLRVQTVRALESDLVVIDNSDKARLSKLLSWKAKPLTTFSPHKPRIRLMPSISPSDCQRLQQDLSTHAFLKLSTDQHRTQSCIFSVSLSTDGEYIVQNGTSQRIARLPNLPADNERSLPALVTSLGHLATFKFFEGIQNEQPCQAFESSFTIGASCAAGQDGWNEVQHGRDWTLTLSNLGKRRLYFTVFNLRPSWQICNILSEVGEGWFYEIDPETDEKLEIEMKVPDFLQTSASGTCEEIFKIFFTSRPTSFTLMLLPQLGDDVIRDSSNQLLRFLGTLRDNSIRENDMAQNGWAARNILFRTVMQ
ncbi:hypothetical protein NM208_g4681 [Fusarium decemcellulare]|uniref:Uncharacterized protein n=2 Tax=Fusarium decemcellulare TaxID=57161 RepID=A0ACC1SFL1_9HYPO|nr:hypothetical protein NM208_g5765 [Fusarium decemcellulare]KAJ3541286.1 hypothetical protein NM208_g4681 [Fusarium decemcellulare]